MAIRKAPAFQFYAADYLADENVTLMSLEEEGAYIRALAYCWREGSIPADISRLSKLLKGAKNKTLTTVLGCFIQDSTDPSRLVHERLEKEREKQEDWRTKSSEAGKLSAKVRKGKKRTKEEPTFNQPSNLVSTKFNSSSSSSFSSSSSSSPSGGETDAREARSPQPASLRVAEPDSEPADWNADEEANIPDGLGATQYADALMEIMRISKRAAYGVFVALVDVLPMLAKDEDCSLGEAARRMLGRMHAAPPGTKWRFWLGEEGGWQQVRELSIEGLE